MYPFILNLHFETNAGNTMPMLAFPLGTLCNRDLVSSKIYTRIIAYVQGHYRQLTVVGAIICAH